MREPITKKVDKINQEFYKTISSSFDQTRRYSWDAWETLLQGTGYQCKLKVLDLGCGNGRFAEFLVKNIDENIEIEYVGIDSSVELLEFGEKHLQNIEKKNFHFKFLEKNILENNLDLGNEKFDIVVLFGVMHHIYSANSRTNLFRQIRNLLSEKGKFIFTTWQFLNNERQKQKILDLDSENGKEFLEKFNLEKNNLEENDYILSWTRQVTAYRYCHHYPEEEINNLAKQTNFKIKKIFFADGKEGNLNQYFVLEK